MLTLSEGKKNLANLIKEIPNDCGMNEAQVRFHVIDEILIKCLGWEKENIEVEHCEQRKFTDYELGKPRQAIWEAKREGEIFLFPAQQFQKIIVDIPSIMEVSKEAKEAIIQAQSYCASRGVAIATITNGHQFISLLASRMDGVSPLQANALVFKSLQELYENFQLAWKMISCAGIKEKNIIRYLTHGEIGTPQKLSSKLISYPKVRYASNLQQSLRQLSELLIQDTIENESLEESFYKNCYCESGALSKYALLSKEILQARYAALFSDAEISPTVVPVKPDKDEESLDPSIIAESMSKRPIVLMGDVGVGKTSFLKNLQYSSAYEEFRDAYYIYIDLGSKSSLSENLREFVIHEIETQLLKKYDVDIYEDKFVKGTYSSDIIRFDRSIWGKLKDTDRKKYDDEFYKLISNKLSQKDIHLKSAISHLSAMRKRQIIICLDNADQRDFETQQSAFIISQEFAREWDALSFISVRPQTFYKSKRAGAFTAYPQKIFTIAPPRIDSVIEKRLRFALSMAEGDSPFGSVEFVRLHSQNLADIMRMLIDSLNSNRELSEFLENITGGNIRAAIEFIVGFIGSPNIDAEKIIDKAKFGLSYTIPLHEFTKQAILGDYSHYEPESSLAMNIFDVTHPDPKEHFLVLMLISYMDIGCTTKDKDGFCSTTDILNEMQSNGFLQDQIEKALRKCTNKRLIETSQRFTFEEDETGLIGELPKLFRVTSVGLYHAKRWYGEFAYLDAMLFDTPIFDSTVSDKMMGRLESFSIEDRYIRACLFKNYLMSKWSEFLTRPTYFDFNGNLNIKNSSFDKVQQHIERQKRS